MPRFLACRAEVGSADGSPAYVDDDVEVEIDEGKILIVYFDDQGAVIYQGKEASPGCFELIARSRPRKAELVRREQRLEGSWWEADARGSFSIELTEEEA